MQADPTAPSPSARGGAHALSHLPAPTRIEVPDRVTGRAGLSPRQLATARAVAEALFTTDAGAPEPARLDWLCEDLNDFVAQAGDRARLAFALCLLGIAILAPLLILRLPPFRALSRERRAEALERLERSPFALAVFGAKAMLCIVWYEHPASRAEIGHDGLCMGRSERLKVLS